MTPAELVVARRLLVCVGGGGVGKTTVSAALALNGARAGRRTLVVTVDPARRLASALGLGEGGLGDVPRTLAPGLEAMMLDRQRAWDRLIARHAPTPAARARLERNPLYRALSQAFAGAHEYLALEEVAELAADGGHDLIVVDTPPARHAFELLDAPARLRGLLDRRFARWLIASRAISARLEAATGRGALTELVDFFLAMGELFASFAARAQGARALLAAPTTGVVLIAAPDTAGVATALAITTRLRELGLRVDAVVANRVHRPLPGPMPSRDQLADALQGVGLSPAERTWVGANYLDHARLAAGQRARLEALAGVASLTLVPRLDEDVHDLPSLARMAAWLAAPTGRGQTTA